MSHYPYLDVAPDLHNRKRNLKELYRFCIIAFTLSAFAFACNGLTARTLTSIVHSSETNIDALKWYWRSYSRIIRVLTGLSGITTLSWIIYLRWMLPESLRVRNEIHLPKYH